MLEKHVNFCHPTTHKAPQKMGQFFSDLNSVWTKQFKIPFEFVSIRCICRDAIFIPQGFGGIGEVQFVIPRGSGKLKLIPRVSGSGFEEFRGVFCFKFEVNLKFLLIEKIFFLIFFFKSKEYYDFSWLEMTKLRELTKSVLKTTRYSGDHTFICKKIQKN